MRSDLFQIHIDHEVRPVLQPPLISIIQQGRNDGHMGNFLYRLATSINQFGRAIRELGAEQDVEVILCDWGSEHPFYQALDLSPDAKRVLKIVTVSPFIAAKYNRDSQYSQVHAPNAAARRAQGSYLMYFDGDTFLPRETMRTLLETVRAGRIGNFALDRTLFGSSRYHIPKAFNTQNPSLEEIDRHITANHASYAHEKIHTSNFMGATNGLSLPRIEYWRARGFDESLIYWGWWDIEFYHRFRSQGFEFADWEDMGLINYHLEHYNNSQKRSLMDENPRRPNDQRMPTQFAPNEENWGLLGERVSVISWVARSAGAARSPTISISHPPDAASDSTPRKDSRPRFSVGMIVFNAELFLETCLQSIYDFAHEILIAEGSCPQGRWDANAEGISRDRTLEIIRNFPDPKQKIRLVASKSWEHKDEMVNAYLAPATGDYIFHVDSDEIWSRESLERISQILGSDPSITCLEFNPLHFWHNFQTVTAGGHWDEPFMRIFKFETGARWQSHEPPILLNPQGVPYNSIKRVNATRQWGIRFHHYSYLTEEQARWKGRFFLTYLDPTTVPTSDTSTRIGPTRDWFQKVWLAWEKDPQDVEQRYGTTPGGGPAWKPVGRTAVYQGAHPPAMTKHPLWNNPKYHSSKSQKKASPVQMPKLFITPEQQVLEGKEAEHMLELCNDKRFVTDRGIIQVDHDRWEMAQKYEKRTWMVSALHVDDDRNQEHAERFDWYRSLGCHAFKSVIELGCGPFTNLRLILPLIPSVQHVTLLDPLIQEYLNHPHSTYRNKCLCNRPIETIASSIEQFSPIQTYDMVVMINVLEHCYDIPKIFNVLLQLLAPKGIFIFADNVFRKEEIPILISNQFDSGHPIRVSEDFVTQFWDQHFHTLYQKTFYGLYDQPHRIDLYRIGERKE